MLHPYQAVLHPSLTGAPGGPGSPRPPCRREKESDEGASLTTLGTLGSSAHFWGWAQLGVGGVRIREYSPLGQGSPSDLADPRQRKGIDPEPQSGPPLGLFLPSGGLFLGDPLLHPTPSGHRPPYTNELPLMDNTYGPVCTHTQPASCRHNASTLTPGHTGIIPSSLVTGDMCIWQPAHNRGWLSPRTQARLFLPPLTGFPSGPATPRSPNRPWKEPG